MFVKPRPDHVRKQPQEIGGCGQRQGQAHVVRVQTELGPGEAHAQKVNVKRVTDADMERPSDDDRLQKPVVFPIQLLKSGQL